MRASEDNRKAWIVAAILCLVTFAVYVQVLRHDFINFDDPVYVTENPPVINGITPTDILWAFTSGHASNWHPVTWISHELDCQIFGASRPGGHHLTNLLFHIANTLLLFLLLRRMTGTMWRSAFVAALFAWHPLHVESVAWIAERKDVLSTFFGLLSLLAYASYVQQSKFQNPKPKVSYSLSLLWFALGLMSKPMLVTLPFVMLLLDFWPIGRFANSGDGKQLQPSGWARLFIEKLPFFALALVSSVVTVIVQRKGGAMHAMEQLPFSWRLANALLSYAGYLRKFLWPSDLAIFYPLPTAISLWHCAVAGILLASISAAVIALRRSYSFLFTGWFWFLGMLVPVIGIVQVGSQAMADRYTYLPLVGIFIMIAWGGAELLARIPAKPFVGWAVCSTVLILCAAMTWQQTQNWQDSVTLFRHALAVTTNNLVCHIDLGRALDDAGKPDEAKAEFNAALSLEPKSPDALTSLGVHFAKHGDVANAVGFYQSALANNPFFSDAHYNLGNVLAREDKLSEAAEQYAEALRIKPDAPDAHNNLGAVLLRLGKLDEAAAQFELAVRQKPAFPEAQAQWGAVMLKLGKLDQARIHYEEAVRLKPDFAHAHLRLGLLMAQQGDVAGSIPHFQAAASLEPNNESACFNLGAAYAALENWGAAAQAFEMAARIQPANAEVQRRLAEAKAKTSNVKEQK